MELTSSDKKRQEGWLSRVSRRLIHRPPRQPLRQPSPQLSPQPPCEPRSASRPLLFRQLPSELIYMMLDSLPAAARTCFALTCHLAMEHVGRSNLSVDFEDLPKLLRALEKDLPWYIFVPCRGRLVDLRILNGPKKPDLQDYQPHRDLLLPERQLSTEWGLGSWYGLEAWHIAAVMKRHQLGLSEGLTIDDLSWNPTAQEIQTDPRVPYYIHSMKISARIVNGQLQLFRRVRIQARRNVEDLQHHLCGPRGYLCICRHNVLIDGACHEAYSPQYPHSLYHAIWPDYSPCSHCCALRSMIPALDDPQQCSQCNTHFTFRTLNPDSNTLDLTVRHTFADPPDDPIWPWGQSFAVSSIPPECRLISLPFVLQAFQAWKAGQPPPVCRAVARRQAFPNNWV